MEIEETYGTVERPSKSPPMKMIVLAGGEEMDALGVYSKAVRRDV